MKKNVFMATAALSLAGWSGAAHAQQYAEADTSEQIVVTATRTAQNPDNVPSTVSVITDQDIENMLATDIKDITRFEPGVSVRSSPSRFAATTSSTGRDGNSGFNVRGLEGNRVLMTVDGVRIPDGFSYGPAAFGRGDYVDLDLLKSVEIMRGAGSALYGSDGLAGVVSFITRDPNDFLARDENFAARARVSYASADDSFAENLIGAGRWGAWSALLSYTRRDGHELDNQGDVDTLNSLRTTPNPQDTQSNAVLARVVFAPSEHNQFRLTYDYGDRNVFTEALSARTGTVLDLTGIDDSDRQRVTFDHRFENEGGLIDRGQWSVYWQDANASQSALEVRATPPNRTRLTTFDNTVWGRALQLESDFNTGAVQHRLVYGGDYSSTRQEGLREGAPSPTSTFETLPVRAFPNTDYTLAGAFIEDQISILNGQLQIFPALRYDSYELTPHADALYPAITEGQSDDHLSPKLGVVLWPSEHFGAFADYASGFKAPAPSEVNNYFENLVFGYTSIPNPDLGPETSTSFEAGIRMRDVDFLGATWRGQISGFGADYDDFISQEIVGGTGAPGDPLIFQYINLSSVTITGVEARADASWANGFGLRFAFSTADGRQTTEGVRSSLDSVDPWKLVAGLTYDDPSGRFGGQLIATHSARRDHVDAGTFSPPSFTILDATAYWNITDAAALRVGVFNITDEKYWWWGDVRGNSTSSLVLDAYTQPGRNISASLSYRF